MLEKIEKNLKVKEQKIGSFNLILFGSIAFIAIISTGKIFNQKIISENAKNNLPKYEIMENVFVNKNSLQKNSDGSPSFPFKDVSEALEEIKANPKIKNIYFLPGQYEGVLEIPQDVNLIARYPETYISNNSLSEKTVVLDGKNTLEGLTVQGGRYAIYIPKEAETINIKNCLIQNASWYGIYNEEHSEVSERYSLIVSNSQISNNGLQGLYLQKGLFKMIKSRSINNGEEGVDLHIGMTSLISESEISDNGEGGVETELGNISLTIENSTIERNGSSGINLQSHSGNSMIMIKNNKINNNENFGIRCAIHKKNPNPYFPKAFKVFPSKNNSFSENKGGSIDINCSRY